MPACMNIAMFKIILGVVEMAATCNKVKIIN